MPVLPLLLLLAGSNPALAPQDLEDVGDPDHFVEAHCHFYDDEEQEPFCRGGREFDFGLLRGRPVRPRPGDPVDAAMRDALRWLAGQQAPEGHWGGVGPTALACLAFQGAGQTMSSGLHLSPIHIRRCRRRG